MVWHGMVSLRAGMETWAPAGFGHTQCDLHGIQGHSGVGCTCQHEWRALRDVLDHCTQAGKTGGH